MISTQYYVCDELVRVLPKKEIGRRDFENIAIGDHLLFHVEGLGYAGVVGVCCRWAVRMIDDDFFYRRDTTQIHAPPDCICYSKNDGRRQPPAYSDPNEGAPFAFISAADLETYVTDEIKARAYCRQFMDAFDYENVAASVDAFIKLPPLAQDLVDTALVGKYTRELANQIAWHQGKINRFNSQLRAIERFWSKTK